MVLCKPSPYSALHLWGEMDFDCFAGHFFLLFPPFKFFWDMPERDVLLEENGVQSEYHGNMNCCVHTYTHALRYPCQHISNVSLLSLHISSWWRYRSCPTWKLTCVVDSPKAGSVAEHFFLVCRVSFALLWQCHHEDSSLRFQHLF